ncbi:RuBisCO large subunit C-terminal-like domain-containing protein [Clostridium cylindrosporum]|uniref:Ribulose bisphosphate carboxylase-like protein 1 n=1 Tax=Clostridium cylindrosporum DSM 605 TaxID=1121307 RepID=A0A0J8D8R3_CLOCY|nr:RuBisCO large subunit C-terminal-like domain-containing protein [Clostridium cylindrosporum]KMT22445.1 ribulose bisphosphate carboxylase-like protein 1 [Clostridium cylindrosporum DSM 605]
MYFSDKFLNLSGERFSVLYRIFGSEKEVFSIANDITVEQTVEFPYECLPLGDIKESIVGKIEEVQRYDEESYKVKISYAVEIVGEEFTQFLNVLFGNISMRENIQLIDIELSGTILSNFSGPRFGVEGIRDIIGVFDRPIIFSALKPIGLSSEELASIAYDLALGGVDVIKDDHGIADQSFSRFSERVKLCTEAVNKANKVTGNKSIYVPNITGSYRNVIKRAKEAKEAGAGGVLICPILTGFDVIREISNDDSINLPIFSHPAFIGSFAVNKFGISHSAIFGLIQRLSGADCSIFPNYGGRFSFSTEECKSILNGCTREFYNIKPIFPSPAGGMTLGKVEEIIKFYGKDTMLLIGGGLFQGEKGLLENCRDLKKAIEEFK